MKRRASANRGVGLGEMPACSTCTRLRVSLLWLPSCAPQEHYCPWGMKHSSLRTAGLCTFMWKVPETHRKCEDCGAHLARGCRTGSAVGGAAPSSCCLQ